MPKLLSSTWPDSVQFKKWCEDHIKQVLDLHEHEYKRIEKGIKGALSHLCIKDNTTSTGPDKRRKSTEFVKDSGCLPSGACVGRE